MGMGLGGGSQTKLAKQLVSCLGRSEPRQRVRLYPVGRRHPGGTGTLRFSSQKDDLGCM